MGRFRGGRDVGLIGVEDGDEATELFAHNIDDSFLVRLAAGLRFPSYLISDIRFEHPMFRPFLFLTLVATALGASAQSRPNVLLILSDDLAATLGCYGYPAAKTPNLDALAKRGVK